MSTEQQPLYVEEGALGPRPYNRRPGETDTEHAKRCLAQLRDELAEKKGPK